MEASLQEAIAIMNVASATKWAKMKGTAGDPESFFSALVTAGADRPRAFVRTPKETCTQQLGPPVPNTKRAPSSLHASRWAILVHCLYTCLHVFMC